MSAYFRMSDAILDCDCARSLAECGKGDCAGATRLLIFIKILNAALNPSKCFVDAQSISDYFGAPIKQAQRIFDTCIQHNVLSWAGYGYNARKWLVDNGFIGKYGEKNEQSETTEKSYPSWMIAKNRRG